MARVDARSRVSGKVIKKRLDKMANRAADLSDGTIGASAAVSLNDLLREQLVRVDAATNTTWAQRLVETLIKEAIDGNLRALQEILNRLDSSASGDGQRSIGSAVVNGPTAVKILEALCDRSDDMPSD